MNQTDCESGFEQKWWVFQRIQEVQSAFTVNIVRAIAVFAFYGIHLANYYSLKDVSRADLAFHNYATWIFAGWLLLCLVTFLALHFRYLPPSSKFLSTSADLLFLSGAMAIGAGPSSWLVTVYFLIIASAITRFDIRLVVLATGLSLVGYLGLVGLADEKWFDASHATPLSQVFIVGISLLICGAIGVISINSVKTWFRRNPDQPES